MKNVLAAALCPACRRLQPGHPRPHLRPVCGLWCLGQRAQRHCVLRLQGGCQPAGPPAQCARRECTSLPRWQGLPGEKAWESGVWCRLPTKKGQGGARACLCLLQKCNTLLVSPYPVHPTHALALPQRRSAPRLKPTLQQGACEWWLPLSPLAWASIWLRCGRWCTPPCLAAWRSMCSRWAGLMAQRC